MSDQKILIIDDSPDVHELVQLGLMGEPVEFLSCYSGEAGATDYITKPFDSAELRAPVRASLHTKQLMDLLSQKAVQDAQAHRLESIGQLASGIAHELNTPAQYVGDNVRFLKAHCGSLLQVIKRDAARPNPSPTPQPWAERQAEVDATLKELDFAFLRDEIPLAISQSLEGIDCISSIVRAMKKFAYWRQ
jgi:CheY-like chemotaxis protein